MTKDEYITLIQKHNGKSKPKKKPAQPESKMQQECVKWFRFQYPNHVLFAIPNGGSRNAIEAAKLKREGVLSGVADLFLSCARKGLHGLYIELKVGKNKQSPNQIAFEIKVVKEGYGYKVVYSFDEFREVINGYLK